ncbi:alcohol dehydrogenase [Natrinema ejinorense]|uniref:Alcohol dehydrogenase n=1 Tax=Natrinema ejinorense TaxID=373386 RepID=A0A2A5QQ69_9EURY|nr:alcohol dehydrogenase [Natrinema ejinorense]
MKAVEVPSPGGAFEVVERERPEPEGDQVLIEVDACGVCHGDAAVKEGDFPGIDYPRIPGHEVAGHIDAVGSNVTEWEVDDRVCVGWHGGHCFVCDSCRRGDFTNCSSSEITGLTTNGGYAEYMVAPREAVARIPDELDAVSAGPLVCAGLTAYNSIRNMDVSPGDTVAVQGIGGVGHMGIQFGSEMGFETVGLSRGTEKRELAFDLGADHFIDTEETDPVDRLRELGGADLVLATAPSTAAIESIIGGLAENGDLLVVAAPHEPLEAPVSQLINARQSIHGWYSGHSRDAEDTLEFSSLQGVEPLIETYPLERAPDAYDAMMANDTRFRAVLEP